MEELNTNGHHSNGSELGAPVLMSNIDTPLPDSPEELRRTFIEMGGNPNWKRFQAGERSAVVRAQKRVEEAKANNPFASASQKIGAAIARISVYFVQAVFILGLPLSLIAVLAAEGLAISEGVSVFAGEWAVVYSAALMIFLLVILFVYEVVHRSTTEEAEDVFSLRALVGRIAYTVGIGRQWNPRKKVTPSPIKIVEIATTAVSRSIIFFGILGRLKVSLDQADIKELAWHQGLISIFTDSDLSTMMGFIGNILLAMTLLSSAHVVIYLIHRFYVLSTGGLDIASDGALGFLAVVNEEAVLELELKQFYTDQIYLLKANNKQS